MNAADLVDATSTPCRCGGPCHPDWCPADACHPDAPASAHRWFVLEQVRASGAVVRACLDCDTRPVLDLDGHTPRAVRA